MTVKINVGRVLERLTTMQSEWLRYPDVEKLAERDAGYWKQDHEGEILQVLTKDISDDDNEADKVDVTPEGGVWLRTWVWVPDHEVAEKLQEQND